MYGKKQRIISFLMAFLLIFTFAFINPLSVSYAIEPNVEYSASKHDSVTSNISIGSYSCSSVNSILKNFFEDTTNESYIGMFNSLIEELESNNYKYVIYYRGDTNRYYMVVGNPNYNIEFIEIYYSGNNRIAILETENLSESLPVGYLYTGSGSSTTFYKNSNEYISYLGTGSTYITSIYKANCNVYKMNEITSGKKYFWDGLNYSYQVSEQDDSNEIGLTDEQIAEVVERFINSDAYIENAYYNGDYFITYDNLTGYFRGYSYSWNIDLAIEYGNYNEEGEFVTTGTEEGEAWRIRPYEFSGDIFTKFGDWLASKFNTYSFEYFSISPDSSIKPRYVGSLEHNYCSNYKENEVVIYSSKQIRYVGEETNSEGKTETVVTDNYIPPTVLKDSVTGEEIIIRDNLQNSSDSLENVITPNADFSGLKAAFEKYISFIDISSITWLTTAISSMITIFIPFVALGIIIFLINRILNGGS